MVTVVEARRLYTEFWALCALQRSEPASSQSASQGQAMATSRLPLYLKISAAVTYSLAVMFSFLSLLLVKW